MKEVFTLSLPYLLTSRLHSTQLVVLQNITNPNEVCATLLLFTTRQFTLTLLGDEKTTLDTGNLGEVLQDRNKLSVDLQIER